MKKARFTEARIMGELRQTQSGVPAVTLFEWRVKYGGIGARLIS
ncbi:hypothetical protein [Tropicibacter sp. S64]